MSNNNNDYLLLFKDNKYYDIYFGDLAYYLKSKGKNVVIVPFPSPDDETIQKIMHNNEQFLIPEAFTSVSDVLKVVINFFKITI